MANQVACKCIDTRIGVVFTPGGEKPVFILELFSEALNAPLIKYFNCKSTTKGRYTVKHNSDFAKLYRATLGDNPTKRFSKADQLLGHFLESRFFAVYEQASLKNGTRYLKVTHLEPETPTLNSGWTLNGTLKKACKKRTFLTPRNGDGMATKRRQVGEKVAKNRRQVGDDETLQAAISLGLAPVFKLTKPLTIQSNNTRTQDHVLCEPKIIDSDQRQNIQEFYDERAAIMEFDGGLSRANAETQAQAITRAKYGLNDKQLDAILSWQG